MMCIKKMIATNKKCTCIALTAMGAMIGMAAAKMMINRCCCTEKMKCKAKKALQKMEDMF